MFYLVSHIADKDGVRLVDTDDNAVQDTGVQDLIKYINDGGIVVENIAVQDNRLVMFNGNISNIGIVSIRDSGDVILKESIMILEELVSADDTLQGYTVSNAAGEIKDVDLQGMLELAKKYSLANGRVAVDGNKPYIAFTDKPYPKVEVDVDDSEEPAEAEQPVVQAKTEAPVSTNVNAGKVQAQAQKATPVDVKSMELKDRPVKITLLKDGVEKHTTVNVAAFEQAMQVLNIDNVRSEPIPNGVRFVRGMPDELIKDMNNTLVEIELPEGVEIGQNLFANCRKLRKVLCHSKEIGKGAFMLCISLKVMRDPELEKVEDLAFYQCGKLDDFPFPACLANIGCNAFEGCGFEILDLSNVKAVKSLAFSHNKYLQTIKLSRDILEAWLKTYKPFLATMKAQTLNPTVAGNMGVFFDCPNLTDTGLKDNNLKALLMFQFKGCTKLFDLLGV